MNISEAKESILSLYQKALKIDEINCQEHPVRIIQAAKSIIGLNRDCSHEKILSFCEEYVNKYETIDGFYSMSLKLAPPMVSYKKLEEALLNSNPPDAFKSLESLMKVSDGMQILEFLIEYSLKHSNDSFLLIWSIYRMTLFCDRKFINEELFLCLNSILKNSSKLDLKSLEIKTNQHKELLLEFDLCSVLNSIYYAKLTRKDKIKESMLEFSFYDQSVKYSGEYLGRKFLWDYIDRCKVLNPKTILNVDAYRNMMKLVEDEGLNPLNLYQFIDDYR